VKQPCNPIHERDELARMNQEVSDADYWRSDQEPILHGRTLCKVITLERKICAILPSASTPSNCCSSKESTAGKSSDIEVVKNTILPAVDSGLL
jgi:hypothetical protein